MNTQSSNTLKNLLIGIAIILTLNAFVFRYPIQIILPFLKALLLIIALLIYGFIILKLCKRENIQFETAVAVGMIFTTFFFFLISFFSLLSPVTLIIFYSLPVILLIIWRKKYPSELKETMVVFLKRPAYQYLFFLFPLVYASLPSSFYDTLLFHLGIPNLYLQYSGFISTPQFLFANTSIYYEISLIPVVFAGEMVPRFFHFLIGAILIFSLLNFSTEFFKLKKKKLLFILTMSLPLSIFLISTVKTDLLSAFFILLAIKYYLKKRTQLSAVFWGFAIGIKYTNAIPVLIFLVLMIFKERPLKIKKIFIFGIIIILLLMPLVIKNIIYIQNPVYPFLTDQFPTDSWDIQRHAVLKKDAGGIFKSVNDFIKFPHTLSFGEIGLAGIVGPIFLIFLPFLLIKKPKNNLLLIFSILLILIGPIFKASIRCWYIAFLFMAIYITQIFESENSKILKYLFFIIISLNFMTSFALHERLYSSHQLLSGKLNREAYQAKFFPTSKAFTYLNENAPPHSKTILVGESRNYFLKQPAVLASPYDYSILKKYLENTQSQEEFFSNLTQDQIKYMVYNKNEFHRIQKDYQRLSNFKINQFKHFMNKIEPIFEDKGVLVYEIK